MAVRSKLLMGRAAQRGCVLGCDMFGASTMRLDTFGTVLQKYACACVAGLSETAALCARLAARACHRLY